MALFWIKIINRLRLILLVKEGNSRERERREYADRYLVMQLTICIVRKFLF